jgi:Hypothetical glycosyl hydrolase family 15
MPQARRRRTLASTLVALALCLGPAASAGASIGQHFVVALDTPATLPHPASIARRSAYVVLQPWEGARAAELKAANPRLEVLVYQNLSAMAEGTNRDGLSSSGVNFDEANAAHPEWFLLESDDARISEARYPWLWMADVGNPGYQQRWTENVLRVLRSGPWDGVFMDDTNTTVEYHVSPVSRVVKYPTDAAYQAAVGSMLAYAGPRITAAGKLAIPNIGSWAQNPQVGDQWLSYVSGGMDQQFVKWSPIPGHGYAAYPRWRVQLREEQTAQRMGKLFLAVTQARSSDPRAARYGWATVLLGDGGHAAFLAGAGHGSDVWLPQFEAELGRPISPARPARDGLWMRSFRNGLVVVNPQEAALGIRFHRRYDGCGLHAAMGATLPAHTALVLTRASGPS